MTPNLDVFFGLIADAKTAGPHPMKDADMIQALASDLSEADAVRLLAKLDAELLPPGKERNQAEGGANIRNLKERARRLLREPVSAAA